MEPARHRPKMFPPPDFPPKRPSRFARTPPAIFPPILGLLGLGLALRRGFEALALPSGLADLLLGMAAVLWAFAVYAYLAKVAKRAGVIVQDLRVLPGRNGLATATMGGMALAAALVPVAPLIAFALLVAALSAHIALAVTAAVLFLRLPPDARPVDPGWHLVFVGPIVGGLASAQLGLTLLSVALYALTATAALSIWAASALQFSKATPPAPLRPLLAIHLSPAALLSTTATLNGWPMLALGFAALGALVFVALLASARWVAAAGFSPMWGAFTFPLAAFAAALLALGTPWAYAGMILLAAGTIAIPAIAWRIFTLWGAGTLAAKTNAAEA